MTRQGQKCKNVVILQYDTLTGNLFLTNVCHLTHSGQVGYGHNHGDCGDYSGGRNRCNPEFSTPDFELVQDQ